MTGAAAEDDSGFTQILGRAKIRVGIERETVNLEIRDYGRGIPQEVLESFKISGNGVGVGLAGIRERLREVDGKLDISSSTEGTILRVSLVVPPSPGEPHRISATVGIEQFISNLSSGSSLNRQGKETRQLARPASAR